MYRLVTSNRFKKRLRDFLRQHTDLRVVTREKLLLLQLNPQTTSLKTHKLTGKLKAFFAYSITYEYRLVFDVKDREIHLLAIGTHDEVY